MLSKPAPADTAPRLEDNPGLRALLDHLAEQLAEEYVQLMEKAAQRDSPEPNAPNAERGAN